MTNLFDARRPLFGEDDTARVIEGEPGRPLARELETSADATGEALVEHGAILFRGFGITSPERFAEVAKAVIEVPLSYTFRSTPRTSVGKHLFTASEYPGDLTIGQHNENSYQHTWPMKLLFCCLEPSLTGGETPLADVRRVTKNLDEDLQKVFAERGVQYLRNYHEGLDLPWQDVFQTSDRREVEAFCTRQELKLTWLEDDALRTEHSGQSHAEHPRTSERLWFNAAHMFHPSNLDASTREALLELFEPNELPRNVFYGDGAVIADDVMDQIRASYLAERRSFRWQAGDVLLIDNMLMSHGRMPFTGPRKVVVAMGDPPTTSDSTTSD